MSMARLMALTGLGLLLFMAPARAQQIALPFSGKFDLAPIVKKMKAAHVWTRDGKTWAKEAGGYAPLRTFRSKAGKPVAAVNGGLTWNTDNGAAGVLGVGTIRADQAGLWLIDRGGLDPYLKEVKIPALELGPFGGWTTNRGWVYGVLLGVGFE